MDREDVMNLVRELVDKHGGPTAVARLLGKTQPAVSQAMRNPASENDGMRKRVLEFYGYEVSPKFEVRKVKNVEVGGAE